MYVGIDSGKSGARQGRPKCGGVWGNTIASQKECLTRSGPGRGNKVPVAVPMYNMKSLPRLDWLRHILCSEQRTSHRNNYSPEDFSLGL